MEKHEMSIEQTKKVHSLIRAECCNYDNGNCEIMDDGEYHKCPQHSSRVLSCGWFIDAVLPLDPALKAGIFNSSTIDMKKCALCGKPISQDSNRSKYCRKCAVIIHKKQKITNQKKIRATKTIRG